MGWGAEATQASPRSSRQSAVVAVLPFGTHTPPNPRIALRRAPPYADFSFSFSVSDRAFPPKTFPC